MQPPPLEDLTSAWRRMSYSQATRGMTAESIASIERSIDWGRRYMERDGTADAASQLAESLLYAVILEQRRGRTGKAGDLALEGVGLVGTLPGSVRQPLEQTQHFVRALFPAARRLALTGDIEGGRALYTDRSN